MDKGLQKAKTGIVKALLCHAMYDMDACWKGDPKVVAENLEQLKTEGAKRSALQTNISIRVVGSGWKQFHITWSHKRAKRPLHELADWLRDIIRKEKDMEIPEKKAYVEVNPRTETPVLVTVTDEQRQMNLKDFKTQEKNDVRQT